MQKQKKYHEQGQIFPNSTEKFAKNICVQGKILAKMRDGLSLGRLGDGQKDKQDGKVVAATRTLHSNQIE